MHLISYWLRNIRIFHRMRRAHPRPLSLTEGPRQGPGRWFSYYQVNIKWEKKSKQLNLTNLCPSERVWWVWGGRVQWPGWDWYWGHRLHVTSDVTNHSGVPANHVPYRRQDSVSLLWAGPWHLRYCQQSVKVNMWFLVVTSCQKIVRKLVT